MTISRAPSEGLEDKLNEAKETLTNATTQAEIDEATEALREARLNARTYADKEALQEAVNAANKLDLSLYTAESRAAVEAAVNNAESVLANELASQEEVDNALDEVNAAVDGLVKATGRKHECGSEQYGNREHRRSNGRIDAHGSCRSDGDRIQKKEKLVF